MYFPFLNEELFGTPASSKSQGRKGNVTPNPIGLFRDRLAVSFKEGWFLGLMKTCFLCVFNRLAIPTEII